MGKFEFTPDFYLTFMLQGEELVAESPTMKNIQMVADGPNLFRPVGIAAVVEFIKDKNGKVNKAILHQGGEDMRGKRMK